MATRWDRPEEFDHHLLLVDPDDAHREDVARRLAAVPGRARADVLGRYPRFRLAFATDGEAALARATPDVTAVAVDLVLPRVPGLEIVQRLRAARRDLALLAFSAIAPPSEAVAAVMAGADSFLDCGAEPDPEAFERGVELAIDRRRLARLIDAGEAEIETARGRLAALSGDLARALPAGGVPYGKDDVLPFREAARRYLAAAARLYEGDSAALASRLGVSYFALRRLLARHDVPFPGKRGGRRKAKPGPA